jgi:hypothetical protein
MDADLDQRGSVGAGVEREAQLRPAVPDSAQGLVRSSRLADHNDHNRDAGGRERRVLPIDRAEVGLGDDTVVDQSPSGKGCQRRCDGRRNAGRGRQQLPRRARAVRRAGPVVEVDERRCAVGVDGARERRCRLGDR